jgi:hypothetical protein
VRPHKTVKPQVTVAECSRFLMHEQVSFALLQRHVSTALRHDDLPRVAWRLRRFANVVDRARAAGGIAHHHVGHGIPVEIAEAGDQRIDEGRAQGGGTVSGARLSRSWALRAAATILRIDPIALLYVATVLAQRLDSANRGLLELKCQVQAGEPRSVIGETVEKIEEMLGATGANLMYAGYPYDPFAPDAPRS